MDLHGGTPYWIIKNPLFDYFNPLQENISTEIAIIGSGITGTLVAHELTKEGFQCCVIDKRSLATGSSIASTSLLQYEIDIPLYQMSKKLGDKSACLAYHSCLKSIGDLEKTLEQAEIDADFKRVPTIFYASNRAGLRLLKKEYEYRKVNRLPVEFMGKEDLLRTFRLNVPGALYNEASAHMDAYKAAVNLLKHNIRKGLKIFSHTEICRWEETPSGYILSDRNGHRIRCEYVVIAAGFEADRFLPKKIMNLTSTYALISHPLALPRLWPRDCLIWETKTPYLYLRTCNGNRIIVGGEDENIQNPILRDDMLRQKTKRLEKKFRKLFPDIPLQAEMAWCGTFSSTKDGLPYIGCLPGKKRMYFDLGYGGNGITFSIIGAQIIANSLKGIHDDRSRLFGFERLC